MTKKKNACRPAAFYIRSLQCISALEKSSQLLTSKTLSRLLKLAWLLVMIAFRISRGFSSGVDSVKSRRGKQNIGEGHLRRVFFLAHTLPDDHSASDVYKENTLGNIPKVTQHYPASDLGNGQECIG